MTKINKLYTIVIILLVILCGCSNDDITNTLFGYVNPGDPQLGAPAGYIGSQACKECHETKYESWRATLHNLSLRAPSQRGETGRGVVADSNENGISDFNEHLDLGASDKSTAFQVYGENAPVLGYSASNDKPTIKIGRVTYYVQRTYGGNGSYSQVYLTKLGKSYYILPVQYNEITKTYSVYKGFNWYDPYKQPIYQSSDVTPAQIGRGADSFEKMCSGCHSSGVFIQYDDQRDEYLTGYVELNTGCESCHGGGKNHRDLGGGRGVGGIFNPKNMIDGTPYGLARANAVCGRCHTRGESVAQVSGNGGYMRLNFPAKNDDSGNVLLYALGGLLDDYIINSTNTANYWGYNSSDGSFIASRSNYQQQLDLNIGGHSPYALSDATLLPACFTCHNMHGTLNNSNIVESIVVENTSIATEVDNNTLCLACHAGREPFENITKGNVANISSVISYGVIQAEVSKHTKHPYSPVEFGTGKCTACHMVKTAKSANEFDITSHTFNVISPHYSYEMYSSGSDTIPNSCNGCHNETSDYGVRKYDNFINYTEEIAVIPESHEQDSAWLATYHKLYTSLKGDSECYACHQGDRESVEPLANPGCTTYCHGI